MDHMTKDNLSKAKSIELRKTGKSYREISQETGIPKSTLSYWLKAIYLEPKYKEKLYTRQISVLLKGSQSQKERRAREVDKIINEARNEVSQNISDQTYKFFGIALYWAEGSKGKTFQITNSDPYLILFIVQWLDKVFNIKPASLRVWLNIHEDQNELALKIFWSNLTKIPLNNFGKTYIKTSNKTFNKNSLYLGTVRIYASRATNLKYRIEGWLMRFLQDMNMDEELEQKRWNKSPHKTIPVNLSS